MSFFNKNLHKLVLLGLSLAAIAGLVACSSSSSTTTTTTVAIAAASGSGQSTTVSTAFGGPLAAIVTTNGTPTSGVSVTFTVVPASGGASGAFAAGGATDTETTGANGVATTSQTLTANSVAGAYTVTANFSGNTGSAASFAMTNSAPGTAAGNYVFTVFGSDAASSPYAMAGVITVNASGQITGGEQDFSDNNYSVTQEAITGGTLAPSAVDGNMIVTINFSDSYINPNANSPATSLTFNVAMASNSQGLLTEQDVWGSGTGELDAQTSTSALCPGGSSATPCGYAFYSAGLDSGGSPAAIGGVLAVDQVDGGMDGTGSIFDVNDNASGFADASESISAGSSIGTPDGFGRVTITLNSTLYGTSGLIFGGYIIDANHVELIENPADVFGGVTTGIALAQTGPGTFSTTSVQGDTYVLATHGDDGNGPLQIAGLLNFSSSGSVSGNLSYNDFVVQSQPGGATLETGATFEVDPTGDVTVMGITDGIVSYNYRMYLTGDGHALVIDMDTSSVQSGLGFEQAPNTSASSLTGNYAMVLSQLEEPSPTTCYCYDQAGTGVVSMTGTSFSGFLDVNEYSFDPVANLAVSGTYGNTTTTNGLLTGTMVDPVSGNTDNLTYFVIDGNGAIVIESDNFQLSLGSLLLQ